MSKRGREEERKEEEENLLSLEEKINKEMEEQEALLYNEAILYMFGLKLGEMSSLMTALEEVEVEASPHKKSKN